MKHNPAACLDMLNNKINPLEIFLHRRDFNLKVSDGLQKRIIIYT